MVTCLTGLCSDQPEHWTGKLRSTDNAAVRYVPRHRRGGLENQGESRTGQKGPAPIPGQGGCFLSERSQCQGTAAGGVGSVWGRRGRPLALHGGTTARSSGLNTAGPQSRDPQPRPHSPTHTASAERQRAASAFKIGPVSHTTHLLTGATSISVEILIIQGKMPTLTFKSSLKRTIFHHCQG